MMGGYGMMSGFGMFIPLLLIGLVIYVAFRLSNGSYSIRNKENNAIDILDQRFANGEISEEEYIQKKKMLRE
ncbi:SHOCT domain-containing protein [Asaccharospora irregularis]|uniref:Putative membrane protein n=1 Tax=Asaccharospora irregularis DSM 2635 TaxID=1121321 RepID=A0A1M5T9N0_9FIRM|nr:SHOCT domain-containing protein [Asaccharospora irregularis]SHH47485.1 putative membrane protein [Asaccharospora irregularis DSM 2635]